MVYFIFKKKLEEELHDSILSLDCVAENSCYKSEVSERYLKNVYICAKPITSYQECTEARKIMLNLLSNSSNPFLVLTITVHVLSHNKSFCFVIIFLFQYLLKGQKA